MNQIFLNHDWKLRYESLAWGPEMSVEVLKKFEGWLDADLPCDVHMPLIENKIIKEPLDEDNSYTCKWVEDKSWWFKKSFIIDREFLMGDHIELTFESLDIETDIFVNGHYLGHHKSSFYPFIGKVKNFLNEGTNTILVRLSSGTEYISDHDIANIKESIVTENDLGRGDRGDKRRVFLRKPQYVFGWDWAPRVATCGIMKGVWIESFQKLAIRSVYFRTISALENAKVAFDLEMENFHSYSTFDVDIKLEIIYEGNCISETIKNVILRSGMNYFNFETIIQNAKLWWPNGMGGQPLYSVKIAACTSDTCVQYPEFKFGIRTVLINQDKINNDERRFSFVVNGVETFCKGGNWIPADSVYARVTEAKYSELIKQAKDANFNMLRVWGGGIYERDIFYQKCDECGIMLWHDFMFACAMYPDYLDWFQQEVEKEMDYQTTRLRNHASMVLWCGNNENHWGFDESWNNTNDLSVYGGEICYNHIAPRIIQKNCPHISFWNSSPYGGLHPNGNNAGDRHCWHELTMNQDIDKRITPEEYDKINAKFVSEFGYIGPCKKSSIINYHGGKEPDRNGRIWQLHNNTFEKETVISGIAKHYADLEKLDMGNYLLYAGLCQGLMLGYSLEAIRSKENCGGALFWMYNDCWGEIGWTIIDYYLKRKISYYFVRRAFSPVKLIMRENEGVIKVVGINETANTVMDEFEYGFITFDGSNKKCDAKVLELNPHSREAVLEFKMNQYNPVKGLYFIRPKRSKDIAPAILCRGRFREFILPSIQFEIAAFQKSCGMVKFLIGSDKYAHGVHFNLDQGINLSDEYFDLLPGEFKEIIIYNVPDEFTYKDITPQCYAQGK